jgi:sugar lactone lactonase YvrE
MTMAAFLDRPWHSDFSRALFLSTAVVVLWTGLLTAFRSHKSAIPVAQDPCRITHCLVSNDGRHALLTFWQSDERRTALRYGLARMDLSPGSSEFTLLPTNTGPRRMARHPQGAAFVLEADGCLSLCDLATGAPRAMKSTRLALGCPDYVALSPDGRYLIAWDTFRLVVVDLDKDEIRWQYEGSQVTAAVFHPTAGLLAARRGQIVELSLESGAVVRVIAEREERIRLLAVDARGVHLAWLDWEGGLELCQLSDGRSLWAHRSHAAAILPPTHRPRMYGNVLAFSPDGRYLATSALEGEWVVAVWNAPTGERLRSLRGHDDVIHGATFLPDGSLASWGSDGTFRIWNVKRGAVRRILSARELLTT